MSSIAGLISPAMIVASSDKAVPKVFKSKFVTCPGPHPISRIVVALENRKIESDSSIITFAGGMPDPFSRISAEDSESFTVRCN